MNASLDTFYRGIHNYSRCFQLEKGVLSWRSSYRKDSADEGLRSTLPLCPLPLPGRHLLVFPLSPLFPLFWRVYPPHTPLSFV